MMQGKVAASLVQWQGHRATDSNTMQRSSGWRGQGDAEEEFVGGGGVVAEVLNGTDEVAGVAENVPLEYLSYRKSV